ncbi:ankyrin repeat domain-containing protein [Lacisediminimonas sp.]|uniref:ankyrin repeat domain-containing protein n=1 Tax=Lacisediminimonas sp. TaxID=3060582 RepID=UPI002727D15D|nr:ankyrin repeat domain-containing protein [Lacisediminimonas sp.]MDO8301412.1 ankyrin repeat domain-containing protein [Lacisediminimonas sp.]
MPLFGAWEAQDRAEFYRLLNAPETTKAEKNLVFANSVGYVDFPRVGKFNAEVFQALKPVADINAYFDILLSSASRGPTSLQLVHDLGIDLNRQDSDGNSVAHHIVLKKNTPLVEKAVKLGASLNLQNKEKVTPLAIALIGWLEDPDDVKEMTEKIKAFTRSEIRESEAMTRMLINNGVDVNGKFFDNGRTAVLQAALQNRPDIVRYLISVGANPEARDLTGDDLAAYIESGRKNSQVKDQRNQQAAAKARANRELLGSLVKATVAVGVIGASKMAPDNKVTVFSAVATDIATNGQAKATQNASAKMLSANSNSTQMAGGAGKPGSSPAKLAAVTPSSASSNRNTTSATRGRVASTTNVASSAEPPAPARPAVGPNDRIYFAYAVQTLDHSMPFCSTEGPTDTHGPTAKIAPLPDPPAKMSWDLLTPRPVTKAQCDEWIGRCRAREAGSLCH